MITNKFFSSKGSSKEVWLQIYDYENWQLTENVDFSVKVSNPVIFLT